MKKLCLLFVGLALAATSGFAQTRYYEFNYDSWDNLNKVEISRDGDHIETSLGFAFPMYFGWSTLTGAEANPGGPWARINSIYPGREYDQVGQNFVFELQLVDLRIRYDMLYLSAGLRWTFMDYAFSNPARTLARIDDAYWPVVISDPAYDFKKSKIHASYFGVPVRVGVEVGKATVYAGGSIEMLTEGYTKYRRPKTSSNIKQVFNPIRATLEGGFSYANFGVFVQCGLTPFFDPEYSPARTLTFGLTLGL